MLETKLIYSIIMEKNVYGHKHMNKLRAKQLIGLINIFKFVFLFGKLQKYLKTL